MRGRGGWGARRSGGAELGCCAGWGSSIQCTQHCSQIPPASRRHVAAAPATTIPFCPYRATCPHDLHATAAQDMVEGLERLRCGSQWTEWPAGQGSPFACKCIHSAAGLWRFAASCQSSSPCAAEGHRRMALHADSHMVTHTH